MPRPAWRLGKRRFTAEDAEDAEENRFNAKGAKDAKEKFFVRTAAVAEKACNEYDP
jgi:hypothetical protein